MWIACPDALLGLLQVVHLETSDSSVNKAWLVSIKVWLHIVTQCESSRWRCKSQLGPLSLWVHSGEVGSADNETGMRRSIKEYGHKHERMLWGKSSSSTSSSVTHTHTHFSRLPFFCQLVRQAVSHHCCVATEDLCLSDRFYTAQTDQ